MRIQSLLLLFGSLTFASGQGVPENHVSEKQYVIYMYQSMVRVPQDSCDVIESCLDTEALQHLAKYDKLAIFENIGVRQENIARFKKEKSRAAVKLLVDYLNKEKTIGICSSRTVGMSFRDFSTMFSMLDTLVSILGENPEIYKEMDINIPLYWRNVAKKESAKLRKECFQDCHRRERLILSNGLQVLGADAFGLSNEEVDVMRKFNLSRK